jgi:hypothetical protein
MCTHSLFVIRALDEQHNAPRREHGLRGRSIGKRFLSA